MDFTLRNGLLNPYINFLVVKRKAGFNSLHYGMKLFLDTEFTGLRQNAQLISLALVSEDDRWFYAEFDDFDQALLSEWHEKHVLPYLFLSKKEKPSYAKGRGKTITGNKEVVIDVLKKWLRQFEQAEIWADVLPYDWVLFCELFGGALNLPANIFYIPYDFATVLKLKDIDPDIPREKLAVEWLEKHASYRHNALFDAFLLKEAFQNLIK